MDELAADFELFIQALTTACIGMNDPHYFQLPVANMDEPVFRERVYCYELYHQIRKALGDDFPYKLDGEVDKNGHPLIPGEIKPDFVVHVPGKMERNLAVIEVKPVTVDKEELEKDLNKLKRLLAESKYHWALMLIYSDGKRDLPTEIKSKIIDFSRMYKGYVLLAWHAGRGQRLKIIT